MSRSTVGGRGVSVLSEGRMEGSTSLPPSFQNREGLRCTNKDVRGVLNSSGILTLSPTKQEELAETIDGIGITAEQVADLAEYVFANEDDGVRAKRTLHKLLTDSSTLPKVMENLYSHLRNKPPARTPAAEHDHGHAIREQNVKLARESTPMREQMARMAYCRFIADRRPEEEVCAELGVTPDEMKSLVAEGRKFQN